jgi:hypothetical protein
MAPRVVHPNPILDGCICTPCVDLRRLLRKDPVLLRIYGKKLLIRGWAGSRSPAEDAYIQAHAPYSNPHPHPLPQTDVDTA